MYTDHIPRVVIMHGPLHAERSNCMCEKGSKLQVLGYWHQREFHMCTLHLVVCVWGQ